MELYSIIPENLFSPLVSKNKSLYVKSLFVLLEAFKQQLRIEKNELVGRMSAKLEDELLTVDFSEEELLENEKSLSGKASFLVRKLKQTGWILFETDSNFKEYVSIPSYSYQIIQLLHDLATPSPQENFAFVYATYSSLKNANETREPFEMVTALYDGADRTEKLVESLKATYHNITYYHQKLISFADVNHILHSHYEDYYKEIIKRILSPLKIRDSVPKYKNSLTGILKSWLVDGALDEMATYLQGSRPDLNRNYQEEITEKIWYIIDTYQNLERNYIETVEQKNTRYTRATTQKMAYLMNSDQTIRGNLMQILKMISNLETEKIALQLTSSAFELYQQSGLTEESLYVRKNPTKKIKSEEYIIQDSDTAELVQKAEAKFSEMMNRQYSKRKISEFVEKLLGNQDEISTRDFTIEDDESYIMTLLAVVQANQYSDYEVLWQEDTVQSGVYQIPD